MVLSFADVYQHSGGTDDDDDDDVYGGIGVYEENEVYRRYVIFFKTFRFTNSRSPIPPPSPYSLASPHKHLYITTFHHRSAAVAAASVPLTEIYPDTSHAYNNDHDGDVYGGIGVYEVNEVYRRLVDDILQNLPMHTLSLTSSSPFSLFSCLFTYTLSLIPS